MARKVDVVPHDPDWVHKYKLEAEKIKEVFSHNLVELHHIGSTAIPGIAAKPTIDMLLVVENIQEVDTMNQAMCAIGYHPKGENGVAGRRYFQKLDGETHQFHLHAFQVGHPEVIQHLNFRDYLRAHPEEAMAYQKLKLQLSAQFPFEPAQYTQGKNGFIQEIIQRAKDWRTEEEPGLEEMLQHPTSKSSKNRGR